MTHPQFTDVTGALALWSTTPEPAPSFLIDRILARGPRNTDSPVRIVVLQTPLAEPQDEQVEIPERQFSGHAAPIQIVNGQLQTRDDAHDPDVLARLDNADLVLVTGGNPERMADAIRDTPAEDALRRVVMRGGIVGGGSAGAMVWSGAMATGAASAPSGIAPLLGWLPDLVVAPHFGRYPIASWQKLFPDNTILGLPDGAVILVESNVADRLTLTSLGEVDAQILPPGTSANDAIPLASGSIHEMSVMA